MGNTDTFKLVVSPWLCCRLNIEQPGGLLWYGKEPTWDALVQARFKEFADAAKAAQDAFNARMSGRVVTGTASGNNAKSPSQLGRKAPAAQLQSPEAASKPAGPILVEVSSMDSFGIDNCQYIEL